MIPITTARFIQEFRTIDMTLNQSRRQHLGDQGSSRLYSSCLVHQLMSSVRSGQLDASLNKSWLRRVSAFQHFRLQHTTMYCHRCIVLETISQGNLHCRWWQQVYQLVETRRQYQAIDIILETLLFFKFI